MLRELKHTGARKGEDAGTVAETDESYIAVHSPPTSSRWPCQQDPGSG